MGCSCLQKSSEIENEFDSLRCTEMNEEYQKAENLNQIKKIQKVYREHLNHTYLTNKDLSTTYTHESKIKTEEISQLLKQLPPLNDGVPVELRMPFKFENQAEYCGEVQVSKEIRHGRGIQIWIDGTRYEDIGLMIKQAKKEN